MNYQKAWRCPAVMESALVAHAPTLASMLLKESMELIPHYVVSYFVGIRFDLMDTFIKDGTTNRRTNARTQIIIQ